MNTKEKKKTIKDIKKEVKTKKNIDEKSEYYEEVYHIYGKDIYDEVTPKKYKKADVKELLKENRFQDIYFKHGKEEYEKHLGYMKQQDIIYETGNKPKGILAKLLYNIKNTTKKRIIPTALGIAISSATFPIIAETEIQSNRQKYSSEIENYIQNIEDYGKDVKKMHLSDLEVSMKVMDDMWKNIKGYDNPQKDITGFLGLDLATEDGVGVCRNMADDVARKLNAIDEAYNARTISVYMGDGNFKFANIERNIIHRNDTIQENNNENNNENTNESTPSIDITKIIGNHVIVAFDSKEDNVTLLLDPTNPSVGIYKNGKIIMFNADDGTYKQTSFIDSNLRGINAFKVPDEYLRTFRITNLTDEQLEEKYGLDAQNKALESVREKEKNFKDTIKVNIQGNELKMDFSNMESRENTIEETRDEGL